jgi:hypothetical protein
MYIKNTSGPTDSNDPIFQTLKYNPVSGETVPSKCGKDSFPPDWYSWMSQKQMAGLSWL